MQRLAPFEPSPCLAVAVSGGADSLALALMARDWAGARGGSVLGLVVDHGLRAASAVEAALTVARLGSRRIDARVLTLTALRRGTGLAERARAARYGSLTQACAAAGILHLLLGHHLADQAETVLMRQLAGSGPDGMAGMSPLVEAPSVRLLRPMLGIPPVALRAMLRADGLAWTEDPSNADPAAQRGRIRALRRDSTGMGAATRALSAAAALASATRAACAGRVAAVLAARARIHAEGYAVLAPGPIAPQALSALIRTVGGALFPVAGASVAALARNPGPATLGGVRLLPAGRLGPGLLIVREAAAVAGPVDAGDGVIWDGRFRLCLDHGWQPAMLAGMTVGALGKDAARLRDRSDLPAAVLVALPALRRRCRGGGRPAFLLF